MIYKRKLKVMLTHGFFHLRRTHESIAGYQRTFQSYVANSEKSFASIERRYKSIHKEQLCNIEQCHGVMPGGTFHSRNLADAAACPAPVELGAGHIGLETRLIHAESGQWISSMAVIPLPKNDPQGMGSAITYARRYSLCAMLGIVTEDDDGEGAKIGSKSASSQRRGIGGPRYKKCLQATQPL